MRHVIVAGPTESVRQASWSSKTGELEGDPVILDTAKKMETVTTHMEHGEQPIDWSDEATAVPALMDAAKVVYGQPVDHFVVAEGGTPIEPSVSLPAA